MCVCAAGLEQVLVTVQLYDRMFSLLFYCGSTGIQQLSQDICSKRPRSPIGQSTCSERPSDNHTLPCDWTQGPGPRKGRLRPENFPKHFLLCLGSLQHLFSIRVSEHWPPSLLVWGSHTHSHTHTHTHSPPTTQPTPQKPPTFSIQYFSLLV